MAGISEYDVVIPPTSGELRDAAFEAVRERRPLTVTLLGKFVVPKAVEQTYEVRIAGTTHPHYTAEDDVFPGDEQLDMVLSGETTEEDVLKRAAITLYIYNQADRQATAAIVTRD